MASGVQTLAPGEPLSFSHSLTPPDGAIAVALPLDVVLTHAVTR